jgi:copper resistance protein C
MRSARTIRSAVILATLLLSAVAVASWSPVLPADAASVPHLRLERAEPAADSVVEESPEEIRLFFSEVPGIEGTTVRLADSAGELVAASAAAANPDDGRQVFIRPESALAPGEYTVHWRVIAADGHAQRGTFVFGVRGG